jgi:hypothetical protein
VSAKVLVKVSVVFEGYICSAGGGGDLHIFPLQLVPRDPKVEVEEDTTSRNFGLFILRL